MIHARRLSLLVVLLLVGCAPEPSGLPPDAAYAKAQEYVAEGDALRALALLEEAAAAGHLGALQQLAVGRRRGYLRRWDADEKKTGARVLPFYSRDSDTERARTAFESVLADSARAGHTTALFLVADRLLNRHWDSETWVDPSVADRDSAHAIYRRLVASGARPHVRLGFLAKQLGEQAAFEVHIADAVETGEPQACWIQIWFVGGTRDLSTPAGMASYLDAVEACPRPADAPDPAADDLRQLAAQVEAGNEAAVVFLDSLRAEGVFERHPRLAAVLDEG